MGLSAKDMSELRAELTDEAADPNADRGDSTEDRRSGPEEALAFHAKFTERKSRMTQCRQKLSVPSDLLASKQISAVSLDDRDDQLVKANIEIRNWKHRALDLEATLDDAGLKSQWFLLGVGLGFIGYLAYYRRVPRVS